MFMKVRLLGYTQPVDIVGIDDVQDLISYCARVSNPSNQINKDTTPKLLAYLIKHKHWSPFEMASVTMEVETTRDIARQLLRHRSFSFQEFSQRYADPADMGNQFVVREARLQDTKNRQNSITSTDEEINQRWKEKQEELIHNAKRTYEWAIASGIAKEQARAVLPEGNTLSRLYVNGTVRSWIHYIELRSENGTQKEHIELARAIGESITKIFPLSEQFINR
jgi:thymidylate synthase (FAD)|tara:strand:- start:332 stop:1000 length:669 start_codon:yes stop_codon:yes gene_type:complete